MKITRIPRIICGALLPHFAFGLCDHFSQSFMFPREGYRRLAIQQAGWHQLTFYNEHKQKSNTQLYGFFQRSSPCSEEQNIPGYFLPILCGDTITIKGEYSIKTQLLVLFIGFFVLPCFTWLRHL